ncbi:ABC transporter permease [Dactylosporangium vinaceum]|uniref:Transport permease protein n=1 Tax=Dactylosporangium vinaceum TaxID=53362 RepID=A0ABV5M6T7_9ACTN|nr:MULTISPECIES: ABC transporter permease [Dactylosporangium]UAB97931.1 ABC transporter permease [Dactylosporangium vinaceum]UWZ46177.1 ABC transporter permease [Dactylosporangium matsuzakiense]
MNTLRLGLLRGGLEIKQFLRSRESVVFTLAFPLILLCVFGAVFGGEIAPGVTFTQYFAAGMIAAGLLSTGFQSLAIQIPMEREKGILKRLRGTPMPRAAYFIGKVVMVLVIGLVETVLLVTVAALFFGVKLPATGEKWLTFVWVSLLGITACTLCGIAFSSLAKTGRSGPAVVTPVAIVLQFISGVFFQYSQLPDWMRGVASVFPLKWMTQGMRSVFLPDSFAIRETSGAWQHGTIALVLGGWIVLALALCLLTFRWTERD